MAKSRVRVCQPLSITRTRNRPAQAVGDPPPLAAPCPGGEVLSGAGSLCCDHHRLQTDRHLDQGNCLGETVAFGP